MNQFSPMCGALVGLARAATENARKPSVSTHHALLEGLHELNEILIHSDNISESGSYNALLELIHKEKAVLAPGCSTCASPCGKNDDYDCSALDDDPCCELKFMLLSGILTLGASAYETDTASEGIRNHGDTMEFLYKALFFIGYECREEFLITVLKETGQKIKNWCKL